MANPPVAPHHYLEVKMDRFGSTQTLGSVNITGAPGTLNVGGLVTLSNKVANVTQITSTSTAVTSNGNAGTITTFTQTLAAGATVSFVVNNSLCTATNFAQLQGVSYSGTTGSPTLYVTSTSAGSFTVQIVNQSASAALNGVIVFNYLLY